MSRALTANMQNELAAASMRPVLFVQIGFVSDTLYLNSLLFDISWNGQTWLGNGWLRPLRPINDSTDIRSTGLEIELVGISTALISMVLGSTDPSKDVRLWRGALNASNAVIADPIELFRGKVDTIDIVDSLDEPAVRVQCEHFLTRLEKPINFRYTSENQKALFSGDKGFDYTPKLEDWSGFWGRAERPKWLKRRKIRGR